MLLVAALAAFAACNDTPTIQQALLPSPERMDIVSGNSQSAIEGTELAEPLVVRVVDGEGRPIDNQIVNFRVTAGGGSVFGGTALTNSEGLAQERWTLGAVGEAQALEARAVDAESGEKQVFATFSATATAAEEPAPPAPAPPVVATVSVSPLTANVAVGGTRQLSATARDSNGDPITGQTFTWSSSNVNVATVSAAGLVTGRVAGTATITATAGGESGSAAITVPAAAVSDTTPPGAPGSPALTVTAVNADTVSVTATWTAGTDAAKYTWRTGANDEGYSSKGETTNRTVTFRVPVLGTAGGYWFCVTAVDAAGNSSEEDACNSYEPPTNPSVEPAEVASVVVTPATASVAVGATRQLTAAARDASGNSISGKTFAWSSSNTGVATVSTSGLLTARAAGTATITASVDGKSATSAITVTTATTPAPTVATVALSPASASLAVGATRQITATARDAAGNAIAGKTFTWSSSNTGVATVNSSGLVTARAAGSATITASVDGKSGTSAVTVTAAAAPTVASVLLSPTSASLTVGGTRQFSGTARDAGGNPITGKTFTWSSSNTAVATVTSSGLVTARAAGSATITASVDGKSGTASVSVQAQAPGGSGARLVEDFSTYTSTSQMLSDPRGIYLLSETVGSGNMMLDTSVGYGGSDRSMRYTHTSGQTISRSFNVATWNLGTDQELWTEIVVRFSPGWRVGAAYKLLHLIANPANGSRFGLDFESGTGGTLNAEAPASNYDAAHITGLDWDRLFDGQWHVIRYYTHIIDGGSQVFHEWWVDGQHQGSAGPMAGRAGLNFFTVVLGANMNESNGQTQHLWWGKVSIFTSDPGW